MAHEEISLSLIASTKQVHGNIAEEDDYNEMLAFIHSVFCYSSY